MRELDFRYFALSIANLTAKFPYLNSQFHAASPRLHLTCPRQSWQSDSLASWPQFLNQFTCGPPCDPRLDLLLTPESLQLFSNILKSRPTTKPSSTTSAHGLGYRSDCILFCWWCCGHGGFVMLFPKGGVTWKSAKAQLPPHKSDMGLRGRGRDSC